MSTDRIIDSLNLLHGYSKEFPEKIVKKCHAELSNRDFFHGKYAINTLIISIKLWATMKYES